MKKQQTFIVRFGPVDDPFESTTTEWEDPEDAAHFAEIMDLDDGLWVEFDALAAYAAQVELAAEKTLSERKAA